MIAEKDPLAMALLAQYGNVAMPNTHLSRGEVEGVLSYLDEESRRLARTAPPAASEDRSVRR